jgi:hypothetical protein
MAKLRKRLSHSEEIHCRARSLFFPFGLSSRASGSVTIEVTLEPMVLSKLYMLLSIQAIMQERKSSHRGAGARLWPLRPSIF